MKKMVILAGAFVLAMSGAALAQGTTVGGPSAAGAPQPPTSQPDTAKMPSNQTGMTGQTKHMKKNTSQPPMSTQSGK